MAEDSKPHKVGYNYHATLMGSDVSLKFYRRDDDLARQAFALIKNWEDRLTVNPRHAAQAEKSEIAKINAAAGRAAVAVSPAVFALLARAQAVSLMPHSCFNFAIGAVVKAWNIGFARMRRPPAAELAAALALTNPREVQLNAADCTVFLPRAGMKLDLGAIAKGFIADEVKAFLQARGVQAALINLGGNVHSIGAPPTAHGAAPAEAKNREAAWAVGLQKPFAAKGALLGIIHMADKSVVSSGIYERFFVAEEGERIEVNAAEAEQAARVAGAAEAEQAGRRFYHHIFDPQTGLPLHNDLLGVSIISAKSVDGEIWSSRLYGMGAEGGMAFLTAARQKRQRGEGGEAALPPADLAAIFITKDHRIFLPRSGGGFCFTLTDKTYRLCPYDV